MIVKIKVLSAVFNDEKEQCETDKQKLTGSDGFPLHKGTNYTKTQMEDFGIPYEPSYEQEIFSEDFEKTVATVYFRLEDFSKVELVKGDNPFLYLKDGNYYELKNKRELRKIIKKLKGDSENL